jgi:hypothetical protein
MSDSADDKSSKNYTELDEAQFNFGQQILAFMNKKLPSGRVLEVGRTPQVMIDAGADDLPLIITQKALHHIAEERKGHGIRPVKLISLPRLLVDPLAIYQSMSHPDGQVVVINLLHENSNLVVAVHLNRREGRREVNKIKSIYAKDSPLSFWREAGVVLYEKT